MGAARRWVGSWLTDWSDDGRRAATLVASELVANVVLHARSESLVSLERDGDCCRLSVADHDRRLPVVKQYGDESPTGRGLKLIGLLSHEWGVEARPDGKLIWAVIWDQPWPSGGELMAGLVAPVVDPVAEPVPPGSVAGDELGAGEEPGAVAPTDIQLIGVPMATLLDAQQHNDELMREFAFLSGSRHISARLDQLAREVEEHFGPRAESIRAEVEQAAAGGQATIDLRVTLTPAGWRALQNLSELLDEADTYCERAELLTLASSPAVRRLRRWYTEEVGRQLAGDDPVPWPDFPKNADSP